MYTSGNKEGEASAGVVVAVKRNIQHQIIDDFTDDTLAVKLETTKGPVIVRTCYHPPRRENFPVEDILKILRRNEPAYILADLNARHRFVGHNQNNDASNIINNMIARNMAEYVGPDFNTRVGHAGITRPNIILKNRAAFFNYLIREGELTTSYHIPILFKISTTAMIKELMPRRQLKKANWELIKHKIETTWWRSIERRI